MKKILSFSVFLIFLSPTYAQHKFYAGPYVGYKPESLIAFGVQGSLLPQKAYFKVNGGLNYFSHNIGKGNDGNIMLPITLDLLIGHKLLLMPKAGIYTRAYLGQLNAGLVTIKRFAFGANYGIGLGYQLPKHFIEISLMNQVDITTSATEVRTSPGGTPYIKSLSGSHYMLSMSVLFKLPGGKVD